VKITIESTSRLALFDGIPARVWEGVTDQGTPCLITVAHIVERRAADSDRLAAEVRGLIAGDLDEKFPPGEVVVHPYRPPHSSTDSE
jgi:hypothetical protein